MWDNIGPVELYTVFYSAGMIAQLALCVLIGRRSRVRLRVRFLIALSYAFGMIVGAKALYDLRAGRFSVVALLDPNHYSEGGLWGGALVYLALSVPLAWLLAKDRRAALDLTVQSLPLPLILAKIGCFCHGCCFGRRSDLPWAMGFPASNNNVPDTLPRHPTQLYEILVLLVILWTLRRLQKQTRWKGFMLI